MKHIANLYFSVVKIFGVFNMQTAKIKSRERELEKMRMVKNETAAVNAVKMP